jgi:hypothetical protein
MASKSSSSQTTRERLLWDGRRMESDLEFGDFGPDPHRKESFVIWHDSEDGSYKERLGSTSNLDRAEAVEMFLIENYVEGVVIETVWHGPRGKIMRDAHRKLGDMFWTE